MSMTTSPAERIFHNEMKPSAGDRYLYNKLKHRLPAMTLNMGGYYAQSNHVQPDHPGWVFRRGK